MSQSHDFQAQSIVLLELARNRQTREEVATNVVKDLEKEGEIRGGGLKISIGVWLVDRRMRARSGLGEGEKRLKLHPHDAGLSSVSSQDWLR